jgi:hypothetical protein
MVPGRACRPCSLRTRSEALEGDSRLRLDLHELWDFDD